jgi:uncharacterized protein (DUF58 family)
MNNKFLSEELIAKIKGIQIRAKHLVNNSFAGEYQSAFKGRGIEFDELREYMPGDDIRSIDWNVTARSGRPFVKVFKDERELCVMFVVDVSGSSQFGSQKKFKNEIAAEIAALLAYTALKNNDKVGLVIFSDHIEHYVPPKKGRGHVWQIIRDILSFQTQAKKTNLTVPLQFINQVIKHKAITFLISDFQNQAGTEHLLRATNLRHDLIAISITDPRELSIPNIGHIELEDIETGEVFMVNTGAKNFTQFFSKSATERLRKQKEFFQNSGIDLIQIETQKPYIDAIVRFFKSREARS